METDETLVICKECGENVPKDWRFCIKCGAHLTFENQPVPNQLFKGIKASTLQRSSQHISGLFLAADIKQTVGQKVSSAIKVVTGNTAEVAAGDIEDSIEQVAVESTVKPRTSSCTASGHTGKAKEGSSDQFTIYGTTVCRKCRVKCCRRTERR